MASTCLLLPEGLREHRLAVSSPEREEAEEAGSWEEE